MAHTCTRCGADLKLPDDLSVETFECTYCGGQQLVSDHVAPRAIETRDIESVLARTEEQSKKNTRAVLILAGVIGVAVVIGIVVAVPKAPPAAPPSPPPQPVVTNAAPEPPKPAPISTASATPSLATLEKTIGAHGTGPGQFDDIRKIAVDSKGNAWVADKTRRVQKLSPDGSVLGTIQATTENKPYGPLSDDIDMVEGVAVDAKDQVYVAIGYDVVRYSASDLARPTATFRGEKHRTCYRDLSLDQAGNLYSPSACTDKDVYAIVKLDPNGHVIARFDEGPVWMKNTTGKLAIDATGQIWSPHRYESNIQVLDPKGKLVTRFGVEGDKPGEIPRTSLGAIALDGKGHVFLSTSSAIDVFETGGRYVGRIPEDKTSGGARDLAFGPDAALWVAAAKDVVLRYRIAERTASPKMSP